MRVISAVRFAGRRRWQTATAPTRSVRFAIVDGPAGQAVNRLTGSW